MKVSIYSAYHKPAPRVSSKSISPIHVGAALASSPLSGMLSDNTGDNISGKNGSFCELTALYWAWKNDRDSDFVGLMHYRRLLDVAGEIEDGPAEAYVGAVDIESWTERAETWIEAELDNWDIVLPRLHKMGISVENNYLRGHHKEDFDKMREVIAVDHPAYLNAFKMAAKSMDIRLGNIALMRRDVFDRYCEWLFDILLKVDATNIDRSNYSPYQSRYIGFLAERLMTAFILHEQQTNPSTRIRETAIVNLSKAVVTPYLNQLDKPTDDVMNLAIAADRNYLPHASAMISSLLTHADPKRPIELYFLHSGIEADDIDIFNGWLKSQRTNIQLHAIDTGNYFDDSYRSSSRAPSNATYNRFLLFNLLPGLDRLLYLDVDIVLRTDVSRLYDADIGEAKIGAVPDWIMTRALTSPTRTFEPDAPDLTTYLRTRLELSDEHIARYFNAGVLLFNFKAMGDLNALGCHLLNQAQNGRYLFRDQDILNKTFKDDLHVLDGRWNVFNSVDAAYSKVPASNHAMAMEARRDPWIIHYADRAYKPWHGVAVPQSNLYWQALINTPYYGEVMAALQAANKRKQFDKSRLVTAGKAIGQKYPALNRSLLIIYNTIKKIR